MAKVWIDGAAVRVTEAQYHALHWIVQTNGISVRLLSRLMYPPPEYREWDRRKARVWTENVLEGLIRRDLVELVVRVKLKPIHAGGHYYRTKRHIDWVAGAGKNGKVRYG